MYNISTILVHKILKKLLVCGNRRNYPTASLSAAQPQLNSVSLCTKHMAIRRDLHRHEITSKTDQKYHFLHTRVSKFGMFC